MMRYDAELKYCPTCRDEYRAEVESCATCKITLLTGREMADFVGQIQAARAKRRGDLTADDDIVTIHKGALADLQRLAELFAAENIGMAIVSDAGGCNKGCCGSSLSLQVRREDAQAAYELIQQDFQQITCLADHDTSHCHGVFDQDAGVASCPACGFEFETSTTTCPDCGLCFA